MKTIRILALAATAAMSVSAAHAGAPIAGLFDTGVDAVGAPLGEGVADSHWLVNGATPFVYDHPSYLLTPDARFVSQLVGGDYVTNPNTYSLTFTLTANQATWAELSGYFEADNYATAFLNGHKIGEDVQGTVFENFQSLTKFTATSADFVAGLNTLSFVVTDTGPPAALLVSGLSGSVPEPASWALMIGGFGMAGAMMRRRRSAAATA